MVNVFERIPYYYGHHGMVSDPPIKPTPYWPTGSVLSPSVVYWNWTQSTTMNPADVIELLTTPSNPNGYVNDRVYTGAQYMYDMVYYWPHLYDNITQLDEDIMFFSLTKMSGHAANRFGWALFKDKVLADTVAQYIFLCTIGPGIDGMYKADHIIDTVTNSDFFDVIASKMAERWVRINALFTNPINRRYTIISRPKTAYIYLICNDPIEMQPGVCAANFLAMNISGHPGPSFGDSWDRFRINLTIHSYAFDLLLETLARAMGIVATTNPAYKVNALPPNAQLSLPLLGDGYAG